MDEWKFVETYVSKKDKKRALMALGQMPLVDLSNAFVDAGKEDRIKKAKLACAQRRKRKEQKNENN